MAEDGAAEVSYGTLALAVLTAGAAGLRLAGAMNDLWLDELISLTFAQAITSPLGVFTEIHADNNHYLTTLYLHWVGDTGFELLYRLLAVAFGVASVPAAYWLGRRWSMGCALVLSTVIAVSYPLVVYSSEARGYSGAVFAVLLAMGAIARQTDSPDRRWVGVFNLAAIVGILSHLTFCFVWPGLAIGAAYARWRKDGWARALREAAILNVLPGLVLLTLALVDLRHIRRLGGIVFSPTEAMARIATEASGMGSIATGLVVALLLAGVGASGLLRLRRENAGMALAIAAALVPLPGYALVAEGTFIARYFVVLLPFAYLAVALGLETGMRGIRGRALIAAGVMLFSAMHIYQFAAFAQVGRGQPKAAMEYLASSTTGPVIVIGSDVDLRAYHELRYYVRFLPPEKQLQLVPREELAAVQPEWFLVHGDGTDESLPNEIQIVPEAVWSRVAYFPTSTTSGQAWVIYRRQ